MSETIARDRRDYMKQYWESHKKHLADLNHALWEKNKESIKERRNAKHQCEQCGGRFTLSGKAHHEKTRKHQNSLNIRN